MSGSGLSQSARVGQEGVGYTKNLWSNRLFLFKKKYLSWHWAAVNCFSTQKGKFRKCSKKFPFIFFN
jgi:hypothetical protein